MPGLRLPLAALSAALAAVCVSVLTATQTPAPDAPAIDPTTSAVWSPVPTGPKPASG